MLNLIGVIVAFVVIIFLIRKKYNFGLSLILGSIIVGLFSLQVIELVDIPKAFIQALIYNLDEQSFDFETVELAILLTLIYVLAKCMQETGAINKLIDSLRTIFYKGGTIGVIPAVYGLMPVPGGALFSAPLIDEEGQKYNLDKDQKNFLNVWFRHIWFPIFPVSSAMILICSLDFSDIDIYDLVIADIPAFIAFIVIGIVFLKMFIRREPKPDKKPEKQYHGLKYILPPIIPILIYILLLLVGFQNLKEYQRSVFIIGVIVSIVVLFFLLKIDLKKYFSILKKSFSLNLALAIIGIMIFREIIEFSQVTNTLTDLISILPFSPIIIVIAIPLFMGLITGYNLGAIALSYFLVEPFFASTGVNIIGFTSLIFIGSLVGYLISPIHLCNVVSSDYLKTDSTRMYKMYIPGVILLLVVQTVFIVLFYHV